jgi:hypothetical protein
MSGRRRDGDGVLRRWKTMTGIGLVLMAMAGCDSCDDSPTGPSSLSILEPAGPIALQVGQTTRITAFLRVNDQLDFATFSSSNPAVATVDQFNGVVTCVSPGTATITVRGGDMTRTVAVTCTAVPMIDVTPTTVPFTHSVGVTACPQRVGTLRITNVFSSAVAVILTPSNPALTLSAASVNVPANGFVDVDVSFNCSVQSGFGASISIVATSGGSSQTKIVNVDGTITR